MKALNEDEDYGLPWAPMLGLVFLLLIFLLLAAAMDKG